MINFVRPQKITNGRGSIKYITKDSDGEILATYSTQSEQEWNILFDYNQQRFKEEQAKGNWMMAQKDSNGKEAKAVEARMFVVALQNDTDISKPGEVCKGLADDWQATYHTDCYVALHWNKTHTNLHAHILASERKKKESSEIKRAKRNRYYGADGKECAKKDAVRVVHKGDIIGGQNELYESSKIDLKSKEVLEQVKEHYAKLLGTELYKDDGLHLTQQHLPRVDKRSSAELLQKVDQIKQYNANVAKFNETVDKLIGKNQTEDIEYTIRPIVASHKRQRRYRSKYLSDKLPVVLDAFKTPIYELLRLYSEAINKYRATDSKLKSIDNSILANKQSINNQQSVLDKVVKWSDFKQKRYINGLIKEYKSAISSLEAQKSDLSANIENQRQLVSELKNRLETRLKGITRRLEAYYFENDRQYPDNIKQLEAFESKKQQELEFKEKQQHYQDINPKSLTKNKTKEHTHTRSRTRSRER